MATTTTRSRGSATRTPARRPAAGKAAAGKAAVRKPAARKHAARGKGNANRSSSGGRGSGPGLGAQLVAMLREHVGNHRHDLFGFGLLLFGVVAGLGLWFQAAGPVGAFIEAALRGLFGVYGHAVPPVLMWFGTMVVLDRPPATIGRVLVGLTITMLAAHGGWHLIAGQPDPANGAEGLWPAAGLLGWAVGTPLVAALGIWGAGALLLVALFLGFMITTATPFSIVVASISSLLGNARDAAMVRVDTTLGGIEPAATTEKPAAQLIRKRGSVAAAVMGAPEQDAAEAEAIARATYERSARERGVLGDEPQRPTGAPTTGRQPSLPGTSPAADDADDAEAQVDAGRAFSDRLGRRRADGVDGATPAADALSAGAGGSRLGLAVVPDPPKPDRAVVAQVEATAIRKARKLIPVSDWSDFTLPPADLLPPGKIVAAKSAKTIEAQVDALQRTFDQFGIDATVARHSRGPTVTRFEIELGAGVQVKKVANMGDDIAYALAAPDVRIVAPIPGKSAIGVEVPNRDRDLITLGDVLRSPEATQNPHPMNVALGVDIAGRPAMVNLTEMPHLLVSGATGSGKSITVNSFVTSIIMRARPDQVRLILIDPKRVELTHYDGAPHLITPVITDARRATDAVQWAVKEMELRYETLARLGFRNIDGYNDAVVAGEITPDRIPSVTTDEEAASYKAMPYILLVIDELADLMLVAPRDVEEAICRIAQMARAVGIHMVIATQRPSVDVITGLIKANIPSRLALAVASQTDSRTILDGGGAEKLVGKGDMLFLPANQGKPSRLQGCFVHEREIRGIVEFCRRQRDPEFIEGVVATGEAAERADTSRGKDEHTDEALLRRAAREVVDSGLGSTSMLQRKLRVGFARAGRLMDELEQLGVVGPNEGSKAREVTWSPEMLDQAVETGLL